MDGCNSLSTATRQLCSAFTPAFCCDIDRTTTNATVTVCAVNEVLAILLLFLFFIAILHCPHNTKRLITSRWSNFLLLLSISCTLESFLYIYVHNDSSASYIAGQSLSGPCIYLETSCQRQRSVQFDCWGMQVLRWDCNLLVSDISLQSRLQTLLIRCCNPNTNPAYPSQSQGQSLEVCVHFGAIKTTFKWTSCSCR